MAARFERVVLDDVSRIGISYPFLRNSKTAGDLFLPSFVHLMRNYGVDLVIIGTSSELKESDDVISRACGLADTVVSCRNCDIFGDRFVIVSGEGMVAGVGEEVGKREPIPGVIRIEKQNDQKSWYPASLRARSGVSARSCRVRYTEYSSSRTVVTHDGGIRCNPGI